MKISQLAKTATTGLATNRSRSFLTILGIVIGITAIIIVMSLGQGAQGLILGQIQSIGSRVIAIVPGRQPTSPTDFLSMFTDSLKKSDLAALENKANVPHAATVMPIVFGSEAVSWQTNTYQATLLGTTELFGDIYNITADEGEMFTADDVASLSNVAVIGKTVEQKLFDGSSAVGQKVRINNTTFRVVGVLKSTGQLSFLNFDEAVFVPYTTAQTYIFGINYFNRITVEADSNSTVNATADDITATLRNDHGIIDPSKDDFYIQTQESAMQTVSTILNVLTLFLASVAAVSLVVGGIGIMNIMLVSVTERTREIGLRKALGATDNNILSQFLLEAVILTAIGGVIGIVLGGLVSFGVALILSKVYALNWQFVLPWTAVALGLGVSSGIGLVFGIYPARQASKKSPIEALRYE
ncbi:MAG: ABC transporter permease [Minisyncoccia bacterium]|jgi:putative ABC transport system permease protein